MHLNKNHTFSRRALAMLLTLTLCLSLVPSAFAAQQNSYHDPAEHWMQASNRTNELDVNSVVTRETFKCGECGKVTSFEVFRVPEYTRNGQTALSRNVKYSDGTMMDGVGKGDCMDGVPGKDAYYTGYHYTKAVCETCGGINTNEPKSDYGYLKNVYWLFDCAAEFTQKLEETVTYEYTDDTYHTVTTKGGTYCAFCYGTNHTVNSTLESHSMETEVLPQPANGRFATVEKCSLCDYASYDYTAAKAVIADYYGVVDGQPHTITVSDLSETGVRTSIRYGNSAESCTMTSAPNYTEEGQYTVYYEITYTYQNVSMTENGVANVWLRDTQASEDGKCTCGCDDPNCGCQDKNCGGNCCSDKGCGENHHFILLDRTKAGCTTLGYRRVTFKRTNSAPTISGQDKALGLKNGSFAENYTVSDVEGDNVVVTEFVDDVQIRSYQATLGQQETIELTREKWLSLTNGQHQLRIEAVDGNFATSVRVFSFSKKETVIKFELAAPEETDAAATKVLVTPTWKIEGAVAKVEACNNGFDAVPTWEDITAMVQINRVYNFTNKTKTASKWGVNIRFTITKNEGFEGEVSISGFGGAYE